MKLYRLDNGIGSYWVIATDPTSAENKLIKILDINDYGFTEQRKVTCITVIAEAIEENYLTDKFLLI